MLREASSNGPGPVSKRRSPWCAADRVRDLSVSTHEAALALARDHGLAFDDALIVASAIEAGCDTLFTEDMQHDRKFGRLAIVNPFRESAP